MTTRVDDSRGKGGPGMVVDFAHLDQFTGGRGAVERELFTTFLASAGQYFNDLKSATEETAWRDRAHALKGAARGIGAWRLAALAGDAERMGLPDDTARGPVMDGLSEGIEQVRATAARRG